VDIHFSHRFAYRVQGDFMRFSLIKFQPDENNARFSTGLVFRYRTVSHPLSRRRRMPHVHPFSKGIPCVP